MENPELIRLRSSRYNSGWKKWGPYVTERQWGTVREDYSKDGKAWDYITHDMARSYAYRWGEEGIAGISDNKQNICFALAMWNGKDPILKERLFGLSGNEGNHGEDVKELYYYLDSTPTHSYMKMLYKYPQHAFPYIDLSATNQEKSRLEDEYEITDTGIFDNSAYFDIFIEYAKDDEEDILIKITAINQGKSEATLHLLPTIWCRNRWASGEIEEEPGIFYENPRQLCLNYRYLGSYNLYFEGNPQLLFCNNETNPNRFHAPNAKPGYYKDGINNYVINGIKQAVNPLKTGTKASVYQKKQIKPKDTFTMRLRLTNHNIVRPFQDFDKTFQARKNEADIFYQQLQDKLPDQELKDIQRQAYSGMLWNKQFYHYDVYKWLYGDHTKPPEPRKKGRNTDWIHLSNENVISMPDKWEYPWYAAWDLAFHCIPLANIDANYAKRQLELFLREYYMHPNGQIPAYEWNFSDVNPPVHAWACYRVYEIDRDNNHGKNDLDFLERVFQKLLMNFTWWVNQKDKQGKNIFQGGFLGLDNIGVFDRSTPLPSVGEIQQSDATSWMAMYCLNMLRISLELSTYKPAYQESASKFLQHFLYIAEAMSDIGGQGIELWDEEEGFFYDVLKCQDGSNIKMKSRSLVGIIPLFAVEVLTADAFDDLNEFKARVGSLFQNRPDLANLVKKLHTTERKGKHLLSLVRGKNLERVLQRIMDEQEFLSPYGVRSLSKFHEENPYELEIDGKHFSIGYLPAESDSYMFGGNSNWRGPVWFPVNYLLIESLEKFYSFYGDSLMIEFPAGSGERVNLRTCAKKLAARLINIFRENEDGEKPFWGKYAKFKHDDNFHPYLLFHEYFHGDLGIGLGASHQTGWTGLVADLIQKYGSDLPDENHKQTKQENKSHHKNKKHNKT